MLLSDVSSMYIDRQIQCGVYWSYVFISRAGPLLRPHVQYCISFRYLWCRPLGPDVLLGSKTGTDCQLTGPFVAPPPAGLLKLSVNVRTQVYRKLTVQNQICPNSTIDNKTKLDCWLQIRKWVNTCLENSNICLKQHN